MNDAYDLLVLGSGAAGLSVVLRALALNPALKIAVIAKNAAASGSTAQAQGGIAAVLDATDTIESHVADTLDAGAGLCDPVTVRFVAERAREAIDWLAAEGVSFDRDPDSGEYHLGREGGHSHRRIVHSADATGRAVETALIARLRESGGALFENYVAIDLIRRPHGGSRDWRRQPRLPLLDQPRRLNRRWNRDGLARGMPRGEHGVQPVSSHLLVPCPGAILLDHGSGSRRRRPVGPPEWHALHGRLRSAR